MLSLFLGPFSSPLPSRERGRVRVKLTIRGINPPYKPPFFSVTPAIFKPGSILFKNIWIPD